MLFNTNFVTSIGRGNCECSKIVFNNPQTLFMFSVLKTQGGDSFLNKNIVTFEGSFLIGQPIKGLQYDFWEQYFCRIIPSLEPTCWCFS